MLKTIFSAMFMFFALTIFCQPAKNMQKMMEDYDYFCKIMQANPQLEIREKVQGLYLLDTLKFYRSEAIQCKNYNELAFLLDQICNIFNDGHLYAAAIEANMNRKQQKLNSRYNKYIWKKKRSNIILPYLDYQNDKYFFTQSLATKSGQHFDTVICQGMELISLDGLSPKQYIQKTFIESRHNKWSYDKNIFYRLIFNSQLNNDQIAIIIKDKTAEKTIIIKKRGFQKRFENFKIISERGVQTHKTRLFTPPYIFGGTALIAENPVLYLPKENVLYIRISSMFMNVNKLTDEIAKYTDEKIRKVVIDIRNNLGGSDLTWVKTLQHIIAEELINKIHYAFVDSEVIRERIDKEFIGTEIIESNSYVDLPFLEKNKYQLIVEREVITPSDSSIRFNGNIYILQNESCFSSAGSLLSLAENHENIINVGVPTGVLLGRGITPMVFTLPNSKLGVQMHPVIDLTNVQTPVDVFHDKVEVPVDLTIEENLRFNKRSHFVNEDFLLKHDPWMKKVLEHN